jgi:lipopolysaccharide heptosyltransferase II
MALPAVRAIKAGRPDARVTILSTTKLGEFWRGVPEVDDVIEKDREGRSDGIIAVRSMIRATNIRYDVALLFTGSLRSALEVGGIPRVVGYAGHWRRWLINQIVPEPEPGPIRHHVHHFLRIAGNLGADINLQSLVGSLTPSPVVGKSQPSVDSRGDLLIALAPGAEYGPAKRWPAENFGAVAHQVSASTGAHWIVVGTADDTAAAAVVVSKLDGRASDLTGKTNLAELRHELARCRLLLTNDTGTMHLAAALGVPVVAIFGSTEPAWTGPLGNGHAIIRHHVECSPCFRRECPLRTGRYRCFEAITVDEVAAKVIEMLAKH